jgi:hypothetical protein
MDEAITGFRPTVERYRRLVNIVGVAIPSDGA